MSTQSSMDRWGVCTKCDKTIPYQVFGGTTTFPRGEFMVDQDYITSDFRTEAEAEAFRAAFKEGGMSAALAASRLVRDTNSNVQHA